MLNARFTDVKNRGIVNDGVVYDADSFAPTVLHCALSLEAQCIVIGPVCGFVCVWVGLLPR